MQLYPLTALVTLLALMLCIGMIVGVGRARRRYNVPAPAMTGDAHFERHFRVHMNTLEWLPIYLPSLWLFASAWGDQWAAGIGAFWIFGADCVLARLCQRSEVQEPRFLIQGLAALTLLVGALAGVVQVLIATASGNC